MSMENVLEEEVRVDSEAKLAKPSDNYDIAKIKNALDKIEQSYSAEYPDPKLDESTMPQYKDNTPKDYDEIVNDAKEILGKYEVSSKEQIQNNYSEKLEQIDQKEHRFNVEADDDMADLLAQNEQNLEQNQANMISQGIERSSIAQNNVSSINSQFDQDLIRLIEERQATISELELKRSMVQNDMDSALEKFDIAYAAKLESKIEELTKKYDDEMIALEKYNLKIAELRNARNQEWVSWVKDKTTEIDATKSRKKVEYLVNIIKTLTREEAQELLRDQDIINSLGEYYQIVLDFANRRR